MKSSKLNFNLPANGWRDSICPLKRHLLRIKQLYLYLACLLLSLAVQAEKGPRAKSAAKAVAKEGSVQFKFNNLAPADEHKDSVLIIFDRYDRTGAGVIYKVFAADESRNIAIEGVPAGKYYVTIQGLGLHRDRIETVVTVKARKSRERSIELEDVEEFTAGTVIIPPSGTDLASLSIVNMK